VPGKFDDPQHWLNMAIETRGIAETMLDVYSKRALLLIAQRYEELSERIRRRSVENDRLRSA
jgi:hypothetical protein